MALKSIKQVCVQKNELGEVVAVLEIKTLGEEQVKTLKAQAQESKIREDYRKSQLEQKIAKLEKDLELVKGELAYNRGEISREEYEELCGLNK